jgi:hypothetical protein
MSQDIVRSWGDGLLIDRKGILRSVEARGDFEQQIPRLLDEAAN